MKMNRLIPMLPVKSMPASVEFYQKLGFSVEKRNDDWRWAMLCFGECRLMVDQSINIHPETPRQSVLYLYPDDIAEYHKQVRRNGLAVPELEASFYGMTEFRIDDPDGNRLWMDRTPRTSSNSSFKPKPRRGCLTTFKSKSIGTTMQIRRASQSDSETMWDIFQSVIATGDTLPFSGSLDRDTFHAHWFGAHVAYVATTDAGVLGMYKIGPNYPDLGSHIASATYIVSPPAQGKGIGRALVNHSIVQAQNDGFMAMQFNYVVSTNAPALKLYEKLGFTIVGTLPQAFRHQQLGLVDAYVMYRYLQ